MSVRHGPRPEGVRPWDGPYADELVEALLRELARFWSPLGPADAGAVLSSIWFLTYEADRLSWDAVADARERGYSWDEVAERLHGDALEVERRYGCYWHWREGQARARWPLVTACGEVGARCWSNG